MGYVSLVEWIGSPDSDGGGRCGYCKQEKTCYTNDGLWAHYMTPADYQVFLIYSNVTRVTFYNRN